MTISIWKRNSIVASQPVVSNTSPLITLAGVGMLALLPAVYGEIRIAKAVCDEYEAKRGALEPALDTLAWLVVEAIEPDRELVVLQGLGRGEADTIALSTALQARAVVLDDRLGRRIAQERGLPVIGTMTVLLRAKQQRLIPAVNPLIAAMLAQGRRISPRLRAHVLRIAGEDRT
jgi:uncharacterized protein